MTDEKKSYTYTEIMALVAPNSVPCDLCGDYRKPDSMTHEWGKRFCNEYCARAYLAKHPTLSVNTGLCTCFTNKTTTAGCRIHGWQWRISTTNKP